MVTLVTLKLKVKSSQDWADDKAISVRREVIKKVTNSETLSKLLDEIEDVDSGLEVEWDSDD